MTSSERPDAAPADGVARPARLGWADAARGFSVLAVVAFHVWLWHYKPVTLDAGWSPAVRVWNRIETLLGSVRIPLLLAVSGMVLSRRLLDPRGGPKSYLRAVSDYYLYVVWLAVYLAFYAVVTTPGLPHRVDGPLSALRQLAVPETTLWYLFALAAYIVVLRPLRRVPSWLVVGAGVVLCIVVRYFDAGEETFLPKIGESFVFFAIGVHAADLLRRLVERVTVLRVAGWCLVAAVAAVAGGRVPGEIGGSVVFILRGVAFTFAGVIAIAWVIRWRVLERALVALGRRTLGIYVLHPLLIALLITATQQWQGFPAFLGRPVVATLYPLVLTAAVAATALVIDRGLRRARVSALFAMPTALRGRLTAGFERLGRSRPTDRART